MSRPLLLSWQLARFRYVSGIDVLLLPPPADHPETSEFSIWHVAPAFSAILYRHRPLTQVAVLRCRRPITLVRYSFRHVTSSENRAVRATLDTEFGVLLPEEGLSGLRQAHRGGERLSR